MAAALPNTITLQSGTLLNIQVCSLYRTVRHHRAANHAHGQ